MQPNQQQPPAYQQQQQQVAAPPQQTVMVQQQPMVVMRQCTPNTQRSSKKWCWKGLRVTGYMQVILGCLAVLFGVISIIVRTFLFMVGTPIWSGVCFFVLTGILGIAAGHKQRTGLIVGYMVMSIISSVVAVAVLGGAAGSIEPDHWLCPESRFGYRQYYNAPCSTSKGLRIGIDVCLVLIGLTEFVIAIIGSSLTCVSLSVSRNSTPQTVFAYQGNRQQMVVGVPPQCVYNPPGTNQFVMQPQSQYAMQPQAQYFVQQPQTQYAVQPAQMYQAQPQGQMQPLPQGQMQPPAQGQMQPQPQGQMQPPPQGQPQPQIQHAPPGQMQPPPQGQYPSQAGEQVHPEAPLTNKEDLKQPLTN
ncbi:uncharacterized protein LOC117300870 [Asterias rubens]|uniref:uncharacterized protein LOC117300870 n=1 Tax=Asterias rubens TaxID=7604 RepID=UPI0014551E70|nr:uncharacterized protein LOC117300870 [Asterias rubens]